VQSENVQSENVQAENVQSENVQSENVHHKSEVVSFGFCIAKLLFHNWKWYVKNL
jgi:hypothetical protein